MEPKHKEIQKILQDHLITLMEYKKLYDPNAYENYRAGLLTPVYGTERGHKYLWIDLPGEDPVDYKWLKDKLADNLCTGEELASALERNTTVITYYRNKRLIHPIYQKQKKILYWLPEVLPDIYKYNSLKGLKQKQEFIESINANIKSDEEEE